MAKLRRRLKETMFLRRSAALGLDLFLVALLSLPIMLLGSFALSQVAPSRYENPFRQIRRAVEGGHPVTIRLEIFVRHEDPARPEGQVVIGEGLGWLQEIFAFYAYFIVGFRRKGRTFGKRWLRLRVVRRDGGRLTWWCAFERTHGYICSASILLIGFFQVLWDKHGSTLHDRIAETQVLDTRKARTRPAASS